MSVNRKHIDDAQTATVDEHYRVLLEDESVIDSEPSELGIKDLPEWYDDELFRAGQKYYQRNVLSITIVQLIGVLAVLVVPSILKVLIYTKQSGTACTAFKRYLETIVHINTLYTTDIKDANSDWWKSLNTIRWKHSISSRRSSNTEFGGITHRDMAITQFGFIGYALLAADKLSLTNEPNEREGLNHFWRIVGYTLGISDRMNICRKNEGETTQLCKLLLDGVFAKSMKGNCENFRHMSSALIDGLWSIDLTLNYDAFMYLWYELSGLEYGKPLSTYSWLNMRYRSFILYLIGLPYVGWIFRCGFNRYVKINSWIARYFPFFAWLRFGKANATINLHPKLIK